MTFFLSVKTKSITFTLMQTQCTCLITGPLKHQIGVHEKKYTDWAQRKTIGLAINSPCWVSCVSMNVDILHSHMHKAAHTGRQCYTFILVHFFCVNHLIVHSLQLLQFRIQRPYILENPRGKIVNCCWIKLNRVDDITSGRVTNLQVEPGHLPELHLSHRKSLSEG